MKVIQLLDGFYPSAGGGSIAVRTWVENMPDVDFEIVTNALHGEKLTEKYPFSDNCIIRRFLPRDITYTTQYTGRKKMIYYPYKIISDWVRFSRKIRYLQKAEYDIMHFNGPITNYSFFTFDCMLRKACLTKLNDFYSVRKAKVITLHGLPSEFTNNRIDSENEKRIIGMFDNIICVDKHIYSKVREYSNTLSKHKNIWYIPNSVDTNKFSFSLPPNEEKLKVCFIGRLVRDRGIQLLIELIRNLPAYIDLYVIVSGSPTALSNFKSKIGKANAQVFSNVSHEHIPSYLKKVDVLLNPVMVKGMSLVSLEAMSCGRPVIMLDMGDRYPIVDHKTGFLIENNLDALLGVLGYLHENRDTLKNMGKNARSIVEKEFDNTVIIPKIQKVYEDLT